MTNYTSSYCCVSCLGLLFAMGTPVINSATHRATWKHHAGGGLQSRLSARWLEARSGRQIEKCRGKRVKKREREREMYKTPVVNETAYLSAVSVMCKQRPFRAARHTIALFAMQ